MDQPNMNPNFTRFEAELEFVQCLANPYYLNFLAVSKYFDDPKFIRYLEYLEYFRKPEYIKFLTYPAYSLNALSLVKQPDFREQIISIDFAKLIFEDALGITPPQPEATAEGANGTDKKVEAKPGQQ